MDDSTFNPGSIVEGIFGILGKKIDADAQAKAAERNLGELSSLYGVDEYGRLYYRGAPGVQAAPGGLQLTPGLVLIGIGILAATALVIAKS